MVNSVAIRLATDGSAQVKADFAGIGESGDAAAQKIVTSFNKASDQAQAAIDRLQKASERVAGIMPSNAQATINQSVGTGYNGSQNANAAQYAQLLAQQQRQVEAVRAAIDPLYTAQKRYDSEIATSAQLLRTGAISEAEHAAAVRLSEKALQDARSAVDGHTGALGLNRQQVIIAQSAVLRFTDAVISGRNPLTAFALEAHKGVEVLSAGDDGLAGGLEAVAGFITPVTIGIAGLTAVLAVGTGSWASYVDAMAKLDAISQGAGAVIGVTGQQLEANAEAAARGGVLTVSSARKIETGYVEMGNIGAGVLGGLTKLTADFAAATGQSTDQAQSALGRIFQDPIKGAEELATRYGTLTQAQVDQIKQIEAENGLWAAQAKLLDDLGPAFDGAARHAEGFAATFDTIKSKISTAWAELGHFLSGVGDVSPKMQQLIDLQTQRTQLVASNGNGNAPEIARIDAQIAALKADVGRERAVPGQQHSNSLIQEAAQAGSGYTGYDQKQQLEDAKNKIAAELRDPAAVSQLATAGKLDEQRQALEAYTHAINTFLGPAEKKRLIDQDEARLAQARGKGPQAAEAAGQQLSTDQAAGVVETNAQAQADAAAKGEQSRARLDNAAAKHGAALAREADSMRANAAAALDAADAFLQSSAAGEAAEARQKAATDATKAGISVDEQYSRQQALNVANAIRDADKQTAQMRDEVSAREAVLAAVAQGKIGVAQMAGALDDETKLRPLLIAQTNAQGDALTRATAAVQAHAAALRASQAAEQDFAAVQGKSANDNVAAGLRDQAEFAGDRTGKGQIEIARRAAEREAAQRFPDLAADDPNRTAFVGSAVVDAQQGQVTDRDKLLATTANSQSDQAEILRTQIGLVGKSAAAQDQVLDKLKMQQTLLAAGVDLSSARAQAVIAGVGAEDSLKQRLQSETAAWGELRQEGDKFIDDITNPKGDGFKAFIRDARQELIELAAINPFKNWLFGENNPTFGGIVSAVSGGGAGKIGAGGLSGLLSKVLGRGAGGLGGIDRDALESPELNIASAIPDQLSLPTLDLSSLIPHFASGTEYAPGGPAWVNENGEELVDLPKGSKVNNAADTRRMLANDNGGGRGGDVHIYANDAVLASTVRGWVKEGMAHAATRGAAGGAQLSDRSNKRRARQKLGTR